MDAEGEYLFTLALLYLRAGALPFSVAWAILSLAFGRARCYVQKGRGAETEFDDMEEYCWWSTNELKSRMVFGVLVYAPGLFYCVLFAPTGRSRLHCGIESSPMYN